MKPFSILLPIIILSILAFYGYYEFYTIPEAVLRGIVFLPVLLAVVSVGLTLHFNRSQLFFYSVVIILVNVVLGLDLAKSDISFALVSLVIPAIIIVLTILPERGILNVTAIPSYALIFISIITTILLEITSPEWIYQLVLTDWVPSRYFDWTTQTQSVWAVSIIAFTYMLVLFFLNPSSHRATGLGVIIMLIAQLHYGDDADSLNVFTSMALCMCLFSVIQESWRMAYLDELTELPGRRALKEKFQKISGLYTVAMLDVDHFKKFNDTYGHDTGDAVLRMIATKMRKVTGGGMSFRYGGEEFSVIFNGKDAKQALSDLELLRETIAATPFVINRASRRKGDRKSRQSKQKSVNVTVSIGVADSKGKYSSTQSRINAKESPWDILKKADKALYRAKKKGRNCVTQ